MLLSLSYCYGDQLSFTAFACLPRDPRHYSNHHDVCDRLDMKSIANEYVSGEKHNLCQNVQSPSSFLTAQMIEVLIICILT